MPDPRPILVTAALPYANGPLHLGHIAGAYLPPDLYVRYQRLKGRDVVFVCGSDEHGVAILIRAMQEGVAPQAIVDRYHAQIEAAFGRLGIAFDHYGRTTADVHRETSQAFFRRLEEDGAFTRKTERQLFDPEAGLFLADRFVRGTCPVCGYSEAYGDQCENCGSSLSPGDLIEPRSALSGAEPVERETTHWYLPLGSLQARLETWIAEKEDWKPTVLGQVRSWFNDGLADRAMTRDLPWGVPVPPEVEGSVVEGEPSGKVLYVWFDAPIGYVSITKAWAAAQGEPERWRRYWQVHPDGTVPRLLHFIGKDNIVFHTLIFPAILMRLNDALGGDEAFVLPDDVPANEFLNLEGRKLSTSRGWAVWVHEALDAFPADLLRYALATTLPETRDADFNWDEFQSHVNDELADVLGNFVHRALTFAQRFSGNVVPALTNPSEADRAVLDALAGFPDRIGAAYERFRLREAVGETMALARLGNKYFNDAEPWKTRTSDPQACANTIHVALQLCASLAVLMEPVLPHSAARLRTMLNLGGVRPSTPDLLADEASIGWDEAGRSLLPEGHTLGEAAVLFRKVEDEEIEAQRQLLEDRAAQAAPAEEQDAASEAPYAPLAQTITFDDFARLDLRAGRVTAAEPHPNADKLLRLDVDLGFETRQVLAGVREHVTPEALIGKQVIVVANLAPRTIRGLESQGMLLFAEERDGRLVPVFTEG
ncbi:MAG: methionine--tRNA ligase, partial [Rubricoccaceae bacterium]|nr:methionine--tRNA ligase [Rubricoccaceae bacterium]